PRPGKSEATMWGMPCDVQRMVACRPPGEPTVPAWATLDPGGRPVTARAASAASSAIPRTTMRALALLPILPLRRGRPDAELLPGGAGFEPPFTSKHGKTRGVRQ